MERSNRVKNTIVGAFLIVVVASFYYLSLWPHQTLVRINIKTDYIEFETRSEAAILTESSYDRLKITSDDMLVLDKRPKEEVVFRTASDTPESNFKSFSVEAEDDFGVSVKFYGPVVVRIRRISASGLTLRIGAVGSESADNSPRVKYQPVELEYEFAGGMVLSVVEGSADKIEARLENQQLPASASEEHESPSPLTIVSDLPLRSVQLFKEEKGKPVSAVHSGTISFPAGESDDIEIDRNSVIFTKPDPPPGEPAWILESLRLFPDGLDAQIVGQASTVKIGPAGYPREVLPSKLTFYRYHDLRIIALGTVITAFLTLSSVMQLWNSIFQRKETGT